VIGSWLARAGVERSFAVEAAARSVLTACAAGLLCVVLGWPVAWLSARYRGIGPAVIERATYAGFALPGLVVGLAMIVFILRVAPSLYQTLAALLAAYVVLALSHAVGPMRASMLTLPPSMEEAAASLGAGRVTTLRRVVFPLVRPGVAAGAALVILTVMKELPATLLLAPTGFDTLATRIWSVTNAGSYGRAALHALALIALASVPLGILLVREDRP
jgi:iron(III) transport system permease protein